MRHPTDGTLRRLLDEPGGVADTDRDHVAGCPACRSGLAAAQRDAALARQALLAAPLAAPGTSLEMDPATTVDVEVAWARLSRAAAAGARAGGAAAPARPARWRGVLRSPAVAALGVAALLAGAGAAAAADWLPIFRTERVAPVTLTEGDLVALPDLSAYGDLEVSAEPQLRQVADAAAAQKATGLAVPHVADLPRGVTGDATFRVGDRAEAVFTFSADKAARTAAAAGGTAAPVPAGLDGSRFRIIAGPGVAELWSEGRGVPALVVARAVAPTVSSSGVPFATARDYLLALPGLPQDLAAQLKALSDGTTLPLPVPAGRLTTSQADVGGVPATVLTTRDETMALVVWVDDGVATAVGGSLGSDEVLSVARGLR
jgi:hypothetical protein